MNTTFTNCAEKKAKQFLNLLQGYTKGIRMTVILILLLMGVSNTWAWNEYNKRYLYFDGSAFTAFFSDNCKPYISPKWDYNGNDGNNNGGDKEMTQIGSTNYYYLDLSQSSGSYKSFRGFYIGRSSSFYNGANMGVVDGSVNNCIKATGWGTYSWSHYAPPMSSVTLADNGTTILGGSGTSSKPYLIKPGTTIKVKASGTKTVPDPDATIYYDFKQSSTSKQQSTGTTYSFTASSTANTSYTINLDGFTKISSTSSTKKAATALYFKTIATYAVTISTNGNGTVSPNGNQQVGEAPVSITATANSGYLFKNWTTTGGAKVTNATSATTTITATSTGTVTANFEKANRIYLKPAGDNNWAYGNPRYAVYVIDDETWHEMTKINDDDGDAGNDIYYCDIKPTYKQVIFCRMNPDAAANNWDNRWTQTKDLQILEDCNLFDVKADASTEKEKLADGSWMEYNAWHLVGSFNSWEPCGNRFDENVNGTYTYIIHLSEGNYEFKLVRNGIWYGNNGDMERTGTGVQQGGWSMYDDAGDCTLKADMTGNYIFTIHEDGKLTITFPVTGYQLTITMGDGSVYTSNSVGNAGDILSFFAPGKDEAGDKAGTVELCFEGEPIQNGTIAKETFATSNVYVAKLNANKNGITEVAVYDGDYYIRTDGAAGGWDNYIQNSNKMTYFVPRAEEKYSYYWVESVRHSDENNRVNVKACVGNQYNNDLAGMIRHDKFTDVNGDVFIVDPTVNGNLHREKVNLRFGYNPKTNFFERAMLTGSGNTNTFLNITDPSGKVYLDEGKSKTLTTANEDSKFSDVSNWVYEKDVWVLPDANTGASVYLTAKAYNDSVNSLFGFELDGITPSSRQIIGKNSGDLRKMRVVYDFKTNRMIMAWIPGETTITGDPKSLQADVLFIRHENEDVPQLTIEKDSEIKGIKSQFFALELENDANKTGGNKEHAYWISLPFDCVVGSISGVPGYMSIWGIQRYNGKKRAEIGWFKETYTFWEWLTPNDTLKAGEGYVLSFDKNAATWNTFDVHNDAGDVIGQTSLLRLYFPSTETGYTFNNAQPTRIYENQNCTITRDNRHLQDGNWKIIGPMSYNNVTATPNIKTNRDSIWKPGQDGDHVDVPDNNYQWSAPMFRYRYWRNSADRNDWKYIPENGQDSVYKSFYGYMVQFAGTIQWNSVSESIPSALAARRNAASIPTHVTMRLELVDGNDVQHDQTFVALDEDGTTTFDQNKDLNKVLNTGYANIYTLSEGIPFAGNTLPMAEVIVPVGVNIATEGEYTFRMPDGTEGMVVELIDYERDITTNLLLFDYTVTLSAGSNESRFALHIQPNKSGVTTGVEEAYPQPLPKGKGAKFLIDGKLVIRTAEGVIYDAQGHIVQ